MGILLISRVTPISREDSARAWALEKDLDIMHIVSNTITYEWPKNSGNIQEIPEVDKAGWFDIGLAKRKIIKGQIGFLNTLAAVIDHSQKEKHTDKG